MASVYTDAASLEGLLAGLMKRQCSALNEWERRALVDLTTLCLMYDHVCLPVSPGKRATLNSHPPDIELIKGILQDSLRETPPKPGVKAKALAEAECWITCNGPALVSHYRSLANSAAANDLLHFELNHTMSYDARRLGGLIDNVTLKQVAYLFGWSRSEYRDVERYVTDPLLLDVWQERYSEHHRLSSVPRIILEASLFACVVRGRYYKELARLSGANGLWHPTRDYAGDYDSPFAKAPLSVKYVVGMICVGAMQERYHHEACECWAMNLRRAKRLFNPAVLAENDQPAAEKIAVKFAKQAELVFRSKRLERNLSLVHDFLITPMLVFVGCFAHHVAPSIPPETIFGILGGPTKTRLLSFAEKGARRSYDLDDEYELLAKQGASLLTVTNN